MINILEISPIYQSLSNECYSSAELDQYFPNFFEMLESDSSYIYKCMIDLMKQYPSGNKNTDSDKGEEFAKWMRFLVFFVRMGHNCDSHTLFHELPSNIQEKIQDILKKQL